jgi:hypothetical protein
MRLDKLRRKNIIFLLGGLIALLFIFIKFGNIYIWSKYKKAGELKSLPIKSDYSKIKSECVEEAIRWLNNLTVDPLELEKKGMKGKKHFVEKLFTFYQLYFYTADSEKREMYRKILKQMFKIAENDGYHLIEDDEVPFKRDIVSYIHACYLMEQLGFDSHNYKRHIRDLLSRIERHMPTRNASVQMMLIYCLRGLGIETKYTIKPILKSTLVYNLEKLGTINVFEFKYNSYMLGICHEIFAISEYGRKKIDLLRKGKKDYLQDTLKSSIEQILSSGDLRYLDLLAEMLISLKYLNCENLPEYRKGIHFIINHQNKNGSFGDYERFRSYFAQKGVDIDIKWYLHTTEVCLWALLTESA